MVKFAAADDEADDKVDDEDTDDEIVLVAVDFVVHEIVCGTEDVVNVLNDDDGDAGDVMVAVNIFVGVTV